ncbi:putative F-box domain, kelch-type beta propeller, F-box associated interaction [Rosa chinensis]|uniref:Putative F-box domain, kelch-type beta propeller, F-box associated interaction n=1 Tax=Rosa chinensis TaxID=74649 RepID=A0A2P6P2B3_ROSCH|nr:putative F-box domain, kelch-type beta propeller, F-box associated interaction [Rosa chinensis]
MAFDVTRKQWHEVQLWLPASGDHRFSGRAVVVGDTIYTFKISSNSVVAYNFWWDLDQEGDVTFYISPQPDLEGLHINKAFLVQTGRYKFTETRQGYLVHLGNLDFCLVQNRFKKHRADREQKLCITTFQVVVDDERGGKHIIKTLHSTLCEVDSLIHLGFSFTPDCDDFEPTEEEMRQAATLSHLADFDANEFGMSHTIPQELIFDILARLSTKDLIRLMCVSKAWNAAIQDPEWAKLHRQLSIKRNSLDPTFLILPSQLDEFFTMTLFDNGTKGRLVLIKQQSKQVEKRNKILGCSNGLLCIYESMENEDFGLWNPTIHKFKRIPLSAFNKWTQSKTFYGFGYDSVNDDYKFVKMGQFKDPSGVVTSSEVQVYSLKLHSWKRVQDLPSHLNKDYILASNGVCLASSLHWLMRLGDKGGGPMIVLSLDLASEEYHWFSAPACYNSEHLSINYLDLHVMAGFLCFCFDTDSLRETWILKEYGVTKSWTKLCYYKRNWGCNPLIFSKCGKKILFARVAELFWYDLENKRIENVSTDIRPVRSRPLQTVTSVENLNLLRRRPELPYNNCH